MFQVSKSIDLQDTNLVEIFYSLSRDYHDKPFGYLNI